MESNQWENQPSVDVAIALAYVENDRQFLRELVDKYLRSSEERVAQMQRVLGAEDLDTVHKLAHQMKGGSYYVGCLRMVHLTGVLQLETNAQEAAVLIGAIMAELETVRRTYQGFF